MSDITLAEQLNFALDADAVFCVACGQPDEPCLHNAARCPALGGERDKVTIADALGILDRSCEIEPDLSDEGRALHCIIVALTPLDPLPA